MVRCTHGKGVQWNLSTAECLEKKRLLELSYTQHLVSCTRCETETSTLLHSWWIVQARSRKRIVLQRSPSCQNLGYRGGHLQLSPWCLRISRFLGTRSTVQLEQWGSGYRCGAQVDPPRHCRFRWRPRTRDTRRTIRWSDNGQCAGHYGQYLFLLSSCCHDEWRSHPVAID